MARGDFSRSIVAARLKALADRIGDWEPACGSWDDSVLCKDFHKADLYELVVVGLDWLLVKDLKKGR